MFRLKPLPIEVFLAMPVLGAKVLLPYTEHSRPFDYIAIWAYKAYGHIALIWLWSIWGVKARAHLVYWLRF